METKTADNDLGLALLRLSHERDAVAADRVAKVVRNMIAETVVSTVSDEIAKRVMSVPASGRLFGDVAPGTYISGTGPSVDDLSVTPARPVPPHFLIFRGWHQPPIPPIRHSVIKVETRLGYTLFVYPEDMLQLVPDDRVVRWTFVKMEMVVPMEEKTP